MYSYVFLLFFFQTKSKNFNLCILFLVIDSSLTPLAYMEANILQKRCPSSSQQHELLHHVLVLPLPQILNSNASQEVVLIRTKLSVCFPISALFHIQRRESVSNLDILVRGVIFIELVGGRVAWELRAWLPRAGRGDPSCTVW